MAVIDWPVGSSIWAGPAGGLVQIPGVGVGSFKVDASRAAVTTDTIGGGRRAQMVKKARTWQVDVPVMPLADMSGLLALAGGAYGNGPFRWVTPDMQYGNVLLPADSLMRGLATGPYTWSGPTTGTGAGGTVVLLPGSLRGDGSVVRVSSVFPVRATTPFRVSLFATSKDSTGITFDVVFVDSAGAFVSRSSATALTSTSALLRAERTFESSSFAAVGAYVELRNATAVAGVQATWTTTQMPYTPGLGVGGVVLHTSGVDAKWVDAEGPWSGISITALEVN